MATANFLKKIFFCLDLSLVTRAANVIVLFLLCVGQKVLLPEIAKTVLECGKIPHKNFLPVSCERKQSLSSLKVNISQRFGKQLASLEIAESMVIIDIRRFVLGVTSQLRRPRSNSRALLIYIFFLPMAWTLYKWRYSYPLWVPNLRYCSSSSGHRCNKLLVLWVA